MADSNISLSLIKLSLNLFKYLSAGKNENFFISPFSISAALTMTYAGSKTETASELKSVLALDNYKTDEEIFQANKAIIAALNSYSNVSLKTANKIYPNTNFKLNKTFADVIKSSFNSEIEQLNFADSVKSAKIINSWVSNKTNNKINDLVPADSLDALTKIVLVNAIYFKSNWENQFKKEMTSKEDFNMEDGSQAKCDMMKLNGKKFNILVHPNGLDAMVCELPYVGGDISMSIILPDRGVKLSKIESKLDSSLLTNLLKTNTNSQKVNIGLPKFKLEYEKELSETFKKLGAPTPFDQLKANFSGMSEEPLKDNLYISQIFHKSFVEVNEEGTEAAAATAIIMRTKMAMIERIIEFTCDRPFIFLIHEKSSNAVLFLGKFVKP